MNKFTFQKDFLPSVFFLFVFTIYLFSTSQSVYFLDSSEFVGASFSLGIAHPPGQPLYLLLAKFFSLLPLGTIAFRINLLSSLFVILSLYLGQKISEKILPLVFKFEKGADFNFIFFFFLFFLAFTPAIFFQGIRSEVYTLNLFLTLLIYKLLLNGNEKSHDLAVFVFGLSLANHHYLMLLQSPIFFALWFKNRRVGHYLKATFFLIAGLLCYLFVYVRASKPTLLNWLRTDNLFHIFEFVSAKIFQSSVKVGKVSFSVSLEKTFAIVIENLTILLFLLSLGGIYLSFKRSFKVTILFLSAFVLNILSVAVMEVYLDNPDSWGYLQLSVLILGYFSFVTIAYLVKQFRKISTIFVILVVGFAGFVSYFNVKKFNLNGFDVSQKLYNTIVKSIKPFSIVFPNYYQINFLMLEKRVVENRRSDLILLHTSFNYKLWKGKYYTKFIKENYPFLKDVIQSYLQNFRFPLSELLKLDREVYLEPSLIPPIPDRFLTLSGIYFKIIPPEEAPGRGSTDPAIVQFFSKHKKEIVRFSEVKEVFINLLFSTSLILGMNEDFEGAKKCLSGMFQMVRGGKALTNLYDLLNKNYDKDRIKSMIIHFRNRFKY